MAPSEQGLLTPEDYTRANAPYTKPAGSGGGEAPPPDGDAGAGPGSWRPPLPGVLRRAGAFILDVVLLSIVFALLERVARPQLLLLNPALPWLGWLLALAYFFLGTGPIGRGRTVGKLCLHMQVVGADGRPLPPVAALRRELLHASVLLLPLGFLAAYPAFILPLALRPAAMMALMLLSQTALALLITLTLSMAIDPYKRGWHDRFGRGFVTYHPTPDSFHELLATAYLKGARGPRWLTTVTVVFFLLSTGALWLFPLRAMTLPQTRAMLAEQRQLATHLQGEPYELVQLVRPDPQGRVEILKQIPEVRRQAAEQHRDVPTTESLLARMQENFEDRQTAVGYALRRRGAYRTGDADALRARAEALRQAVWQVAADAPETATLPRVEPGNPPAAPSAPGPLWPERPHHFALLIYEPFQLLFNNAVNLRATISGPADPAAGPLVVREIAPPAPTPWLPSHEDAASTATQEAAATAP